MIPTEAIASTWTTSHKSHDCALLPTPKLNEKRAWQDKSQSLGNEFSGSFNALPQDCMWQSTKWGKWHPDSPWGIYHGGPNLSLWSLTKLHWKKSMGRTWTQKNIRSTCCHSNQEDQKFSFTSNWPGGNQQIPETRRVINKTSRHLWIQIYFLWLIGLANVGHPGLLWREFICTAMLPMKHGVLQNLGSRWASKPSSLYNG